MDLDAGSEQVELMMRFDFDNVAGEAELKMELEIGPDQAGTELMLELLGKGSD